MREERAAASLPGLMMSTYLWGDGGGEGAMVVQHAHTDTVNWAAGRTSACGGLQGGRRWSCCLTLAHDALSRVATYICSSVSHAATAGRLKSPLEVRVTFICALKSLISMWMIVGCILMHPLLINRLFVVFFFLWLSRLASTKTKNSSSVCC